MKAWRQAGHVIFFLKAGWANLEIWQQIRKLAKCFPGIVALAQRAKAGDSFPVSVHGKIETD